MSEKINKLDKKDYIRNLRKKMLAITSNLSQLQREFPELKINSKLFISIMTQENKEATLIDYNSIRREEAMDNIMHSLQEDSYVISEMNRFLGVFQAMDMFGASYVKCVSNQDELGEMDHIEIDKVYKVVDYQVYEKELFLNLEDLDGNTIVNERDENTYGYSSYLFEVKTVAEMN